MGGNLSIDNISPLFSSGRLASEFPVHQPSAVFDVLGDAAATRFRSPPQWIVEQSSMRRARVRAVQSEIETCTYETSERISGTVDRLLDVIVQSGRKVRLSRV